MSQSSRDQHQRTLAVWKSSDDSGPPPDLSHQPLQRVVGLDTTPVLRWHRVVAQRLVDAVLDDLRGLPQLAPSCLLGGLAPPAYTNLPSLQPQPSVQKIAYVIGGEVVSRRLPWITSVEGLSRKPHSESPDLFLSSPFNSINFDPAIQSQFSPRYAHFRAFAKTLLGELWPLRRDPPAEAHLPRKLR